MNTAPTETIVAAKPILRASSLFPVFQYQGISSRILFMGYWFVKRNITELTQVTTLRDSQGNVLVRFVTTIKEAKGYRIELTELLQKAGRHVDSEFEGTVEVEFFSLQNLVFPFPALLVNYYGEDFSTCVHTAQRVYNNYEDMQANSETKVPEAGFNVYSTDNIQPFVTLLNGPEKCPNSHLHVECFNHAGHVLKEHINLGDLAPYQAKTIHLNEVLPLDKFLNQRVGTLRIAFDVRWVFPRLLVGNRQLNPPAMAITHTYYDCTRANTSSDYWYAVNDEWYTAALMLPLCAQGNAQTKYYFYPIYSPSSFSVDLEIYNKDGERVATVPKALHITSPSSSFENIDAAAHVRRLGLENEFPLGARLIARPDEGTNLPARIKLALDIGASPKSLPCNICTNLQPFNPSWIDKKHSFKWAPILSDQPNPEVWIMNSCPQIHYKSEAEIVVRFYREADTEVIERIYHLPPHGSMVIRIDEDDELKNFMGNLPGWLTAVSTNPYTTTYYFSRPSEGVVGGDHGF
jgi:hypothetical protein